AGHFANSIDKVQPDSSRLIEFSTNLIPITGGFRYYFDTKDAPRAIAIANPYLAAGAGVYMRSQSVTQQFGLKASGDSSTASFGIYPGAGVEFNIYRKHIYLGMDLRYH